MWQVYYPFLLINKKRYAGLYWTREDRYDKLDTKGIESVRRDNCPLVKDVIDTCLTKLLVDRDKEGAVKSACLAATQRSGSVAHACARGSMNIPRQSFALRRLRVCGWCAVCARSYAKGIISDLLQNKLDMSLLVISKQLTKNPEDYAAQSACAFNSRPLLFRCPSPFDLRCARGFGVLHGSTRPDAAEQRAWRGIGGERTAHTCAQPYRAVEVFVAVAGYLRPPTPFLLIALSCGQCVRAQAAACRTC